jgi:uncharacterized protein
MTWAPRAIRPEERHPFPDLVRGAALLGIGLANVQIMSAPYLATQGHLRLWTDPANDITQAAVRFFFASTSFVLFAILFGAGFARLMEKRADLPGVGIGYYWRRLAVLAGLGVLHIGLLWFGDVLLLYALCGMALLLFRDCRERTLWIWLGVAAATPLLAMAGLHGLFWLSSLADPTIGSQAWLAETLFAMAENRDELVDVYSTGTYGEIVRARLGEFGDALWTLPMFGPLVFAGMLLGMILARRGVLAAPERHGPFYRRALWVALPLAVAGKGFYALRSDDAGILPDGLNYALMAATAVGGLAMALVYLAALRALWLSGKARRLVEHVRAAGRMTLTHYLGQSLVATTLFFSYGCGWYGAVNNWQGVLVMLVIYAAQVAVSPAWLRRFGIGPVEWLARRVSYGPPRPPALPPPLPPPAAS